MNYPPEFLVEVVYDQVPHPVPVSRILLSCQTCGVHHQFPPGAVNLELLNELVAAHVNLHLMEAIYDRHSK